LVDPRSQSLRSNPFAAAAPSTIEATPSRKIGLISGVSPICIRESPDSETTGFVSSIDAANGF
jgi:hypothetical protein